MVFIPCECYLPWRQCCAAIYPSSEKFPEEGFEKACLIEYPRRGIWALGFISTDTKGEVASKTGEPDEPMVCCNRHRMQPLLHQRNRCPAFS